MLICEAMTDEKKKKPLKFVCSISIEHILYQIYRKKSIALIIFSVSQPEEQVKKIDVRRLNQFSFIFVSDPREAGFVKESNDSSRR